MINPKIIQLIREIPSTYVNVVVYTSYQDWKVGKIKRKANPKALLLLSVFKCKKGFRLVIPGLYDAIQQL